jgi:hypothetical protein
MREVLIKPLQLCAQFLALIRGQVSFVAKPTCGHKDSLLDARILINLGSDKAARSSDQRRENGPGHE